ncbi:MAG TPA: cytochrome C oxidase subunit IV family protein [Rhodanobacteraceae bacterium]|nr:cytochrome C oxidase subunit IV family protein [Rhodanobacteraceae bacterium]
MNGPRRKNGRLPVADLLAVLGVLVLLLGASIGSSLVPLGGWNTVVSLVASVLMALTILGFFMHLRHGTVLLRMVAAIGFVWLAILIVITFGDYFTRIPVPPPW